MFLSAGVLYGMVRAMNPNPEVNPGFLECIGYCFGGTIAGRLPFGLFIWGGYWSYIFSQIFFLNTVAMILCLVVMGLVNFGAAQVIITMLTP
jgi:hypothetical protein